jgi:hypothetical protein
MAGVAFPNTDTHWDWVQASRPYVGFPWIREEFSTSKSSVLFLVLCVLLFERERDRERQRERERQRQRQRQKQPEAFLKADTT